MRFFQKKGVILMNFMFNAEDFSHCFSACRNAAQKSLNHLDYVFFTKRGSYIYMHSLNGYSMPVYMRSTGENVPDFTVCVRYSAALDAIVKTAKKGFVYIDTEAETIEFSSISYKEPIIKFDESMMYNTNHVLDRIIECVKNEKFTKATNISIFNINMFELVVLKKKNTYTAFSTGGSEPMVLVDNERNDYIGILMPMVNTPSTVLDEENKIRSFFGLEEKEDPENSFE